MRMTAIGEAHEVRFHVVSLPHTQTTIAYSSCAYTQKVRGFCRMMKDLGHFVVLYSGEENDASCDEHVCCITEYERAASLGGKPYSSGSFDASMHHWRAFNRNVVDAINKIAEPTDFVCVIGGISHKPIADALPHMMTVEFGIGYGGSFSKYRVFESYAWMHTCYGAERPRDPHGIDGAWFDDVVPGYLDVDAFPFRAKKDDYFLFVGRMISRKGVAVASDVCRRSGVRLVLAGEGPNIPEYGEYVGPVGVAERNRLMAGARALIMPTIYVEPFGNVAIEAMACGTPVISTDWGAMTETVVEGVTGFRCRTLAEFMDAFGGIDRLDPGAIRQHVVRNYSLPVIAKRYERHFERLSQLWDDGWYAERGAKEVPTCH